MFLAMLLVCAAWLVCYIKCKQLRPRVDVEIVRGAPAVARQRWAACVGAGARLAHTPWSGLVPGRAGLSLGQPTQAQRDHNTGHIL